jgi:hypothetical protein
VDRLRFPVNALEIVEVLRCMLDVDILALPVIVEELWSALEVDGFRLAVDALEIAVIEREKSDECNIEHSARGPEPDVVGNTPFSKSKKGKRL